MQKQQIAKLNYLNIAPRKVRLLSDSIKGLSLLEAQAQLLLRPNRASEPLLKLLRSAAANAKNKQMNADNLVVATIIVNPAPVLKRSLPRAQGRATPILKRMSHITVVLKESEKPLAQRFSIIKPEKAKKPEKEKSAKAKAKSLEKTKDAKSEKNIEKEKPVTDGQKKVRTPSTLRRFFQRRTGQ